MILFPAAPAQCETLKFFAVHYFPDTPFPEFRALWHEGFALAQGQDYTSHQDALGAYVFIHFQNMIPKEIRVTDLCVDGVKLSEGLGRTNDACGDLYGHSIAVSKIPDIDKEKLRAAGEPVWWKVEPLIVAPKGVGQIVVRLKRQPQRESFTVEIVLDSGHKASPIHVYKNKVDPRFAGVYFTPNLDTIYAYLRHPKGAINPTRVYLDGKDVTAKARFGLDGAVDLIPVIISLPSPLELMSYHCLRIGFSDGSAATSGVRAWGHEFVYGIWGSGSDPRTAYRNWAAHNFNVHMGHGDKATMEMSLDPDGFRFLQSLGFRNMATWYGNARNPIFYFLLDEPDAQDYGIDDLPANERLGLLGQALVAKLNELRRLDPKVPILLNVDGTYKPQNWPTYHQLADIACVDPYYQGELDMVYTKRPGRFWTFTKPAYVRAVTEISQSACQPKPLHVILCSTRYRDSKPNSDYTGRYPTPEEKRLEAYYAIGAGAKGISYWWFTAAGECYGMGSDEPAAKALYRSVGLLGAELRTAGPIITLSQPVNLDVKAPRLVSVRCLARGTDSLALVLTNDNVLCDRLGTIYKPIEKVKVSVTLPASVQPVDVFEITIDGIKDVGWEIKDKTLQLDLDTLELTRFLVATSDPKLRGELQRLYESKFAANVKALKAE
jgi:hypothetical protein